MINLNFSAPQQILFGCGKLESLVSYLKNIGSKLFIARTASGNGFISLLNIIEKSGLKWVDYVVKKEPDYDSVLNATSIALNSGCDCIASIGGGSVIDTGKVVSVMLTNQGKLIDYLEVVGLGKQLENPGLPHVAIPTTSGTGSEVTRNAVLLFPDKEVKVSLRSDFLFAKIACVDPNLTISVPRTTTAFSGMDAFVQVIESYISKKSNHLTDLLCLDAIGKAPDSLLRAYENGDDISAREKMSWISLLGGLCLANSGLGAVHGFAGSIGGMYPIAHGAICASLLPSVLSVNIEALKLREPENPAFEKIKEILQIVTKKENTNFQEGVDWFKQLNIKLMIPSLTEMGVQKGDFLKIIDRAKHSSSMKGNPIHLNDEELWKIIEGAG